MVREIVKYTMLLMRKASPASKADLTTARDLLDTLRYHAAGCAGMAANMIGVNKNIIAVFIGEIPVLMINPRLVSHSPESYETEEGCLSLTGTRKTSRWYSVEVEYYDMMMKKHRINYSGFTAEVIQHEMDHCNGVVI